MDKDLKEFFDDQQKYISLAISSSEKRLITRIDGLGGRLGKVETRLDKLEGRFDRLDRDVKIGFQVLDGRIRHVDRRLSRMNQKMTREFAAINKTLKKLERRGRRG